MWINGCVATNLTGAADAVSIEGVGCRVQVDGFTGTTGNTGVGIRISQARNSILTINDNNPAGVTVSGTLGDVAVSNGVVVTYADLLITNVIDVRGNEIRQGDNTSAGMKIVTLGIEIFNGSGGTLAVGDIVRPNGIGTQVTKAQGDSLANAAGPLLTMITSPVDGAIALATPIGQGALVNFDVAPAIGALTYLDEGMAGVATTTVPPAGGVGPNQKLRLGRTLIVSGTRARIVGSPENFPVDSNGIAP